MRQFLILCTFSLFLSASTFDQAIESILLFDQSTLEKSVTTKLQANEANTKGKTLVMLCAYKGNTQALDFLIKLGADVNSADNEGRTALMLSLWNDFEDISFILLQNGANPSAKANDGTTPLHIARLKNNKKMIDDLVKRGVKE